ncbi:MAG: Methyltransferase family protein [Candidatus Collierbacteria bacterium GW2011_GWC2_44_18]|uniref:Methyltransferase family protein n=2 Tax=Microgenomates group TaxID=1794810 RepID=A0A0G1J7T8_9BACT|nr:MAG: Methyltransferase family protein [Candidatus Collierbacteria bacterium GW2011_GWC2_44_18]KKT67355.1 MAG: Methyltransferase family protein [Candidatus Woesebacteria bacterium GW2011_GWA2_44_33]
MKFSAHDQERMNDFYDSKVRSHGVNTPQGLSWISDHTQKTRFKVLSEIGDLNNKSILDVGCGFGDLYQYLSNRFHGFLYTGIDVTSLMIETAKKNLPHIKFIEGDYGQFQTNEFDYILASGSLSFMVDNYKDVYYAMIKKMFFDSKLGVAFNMLDQKHHKQDETFATYSPSEIAGYCFGLTKNVILREDYLHGDFTIYLYH